MYSVGSKVHTEYGHIQGTWKAHLKDAQTINIQPMSGRYLLSLYHPDKLGRETVPSHHHMMHSFPSTPTRRRHSSGVDPTFTYTSPRSSYHNPQNNGFSDRRLYHSRTSSLYSIPSPSTPRPISSHDGRGGFGTANGFGNALDSSNGLGNLADELAEAWDEEGEVVADEGLSGPHSDEQELIYNGNRGMSEEFQHGSREEISIDTGFPVFPSSVEPSTTLLSPQKPSTQLKNRRQNPHYDGSEYGDDSDFEDATGISPSLEARMIAVDWLARRGTESNGSDPDMIVQRVAESLKDLGSQSGLEQSATRLVLLHFRAFLHSRWLA